MKTPTAISFLAILTLILSINAGCKNTNNLYEEQKKFESSGIASFGESELALLAKGQMLQNEGKHEEAVKIFEQLIEKNSKEPNVWNYAAKSYAKLENIQKTLYAYRQAIESAEADPMYKDDLAFVEDFIAYCEETEIAPDCLDGYEIMFKKAPKLQYDYQKKNAAYVLRDSAVELRNWGKEDLAKQAESISSQLLKGLPD